MNIAGIPAGGANVPAFNINLQNNVEHPNRQQDLVVLQQSAGRSLEKMQELFPRMTETHEKMKTSFKIWQFAKLKQEARAGWGVLGRMFSRRVGTLTPLLDASGDFQEADKVRNQLNFHVQSYIQQNRALISYLPHEAAFDPVQKAEDTKLTGSPTQPDFDRHQNTLKLQFRRLAANRNGILWQNNYYAWLTSVEEAVPREIPTDTFIEHNGFWALKEIVQEEVPLEEDLQQDLQNARAAELYNIKREAQSAVRSEIIKNIASKVLAVGAFLVTCYLVKEIKAEFFSKA